MEPFSSLTPIEGGWSGETFVAEAAGERSIVRIFASPRHHPQAALIQEAVLRFVRGLVPVPAVKEVRRAEPDADVPGLLVTEFLPGARGDLLLPTLDTRGLATVGERLGAIAGTLAGMPQLTAGLFADESLRVEPFDPDLDDWVARHEERLGWDDGDLDGLRTVAADAQAILDDVERVSLVHSDLNPKNILLDAGTLEVTGLIDWEFAHAGSPYADLGNLLRFDRDPAYADGVLRGYAGLRGDEPATALDRARCADLLALVDLAVRKDADPVAARAHDRLLAIARARDVHATG